MTKHPTPLCSQSSSVQRNDSLLQMASDTGSQDRQALSRLKVGLYLNYIGCPKVLHEPVPSVETLKQIQTRHHARIPFDNLILHYSKHREIFIDLDYLFHKMVGTGRGGDCIENGLLFAAVLRGLGYNLITVGARVNSSWGGGPDVGQYGPISHMVSIVTVGNQKWMVDAHFGGNEPSQPLLVEAGAVASPSKNTLEMRIIWDNINGSKDAAQKVWIYQYRNSKQREWKGIYAFSEQEHFPSDFAIISYALSTRRTSWYTYRIICIKALLSESDDEVIGSIMLVGTVVKTRVEGEEKVLQVCNSELERIDALRKWFGISLSEEEQKGITGLVTEIRVQGGL